jgi:serine protease SohB
MIDFLSQYGLFLAKSLTLAITLLLILAGILALVVKSKGGQRKLPQLRNLNKDYQQQQLQLLEHCEDKKKLKAQRKKWQAFNKKLPHKRLFVLDFTGDIKAQSVQYLRDEITTILLDQRPGDEVMVRIESAGGMVHAYGLAASQLDRIRQANIPLTAVVDKVAASGGYLMACVADQVIAAPFAIIGSIGVLAQLPNFHRWLQKHDVDFEQIMAGQYKRTLTMLGKNTQEGREKFQEEINEVHDLFKQFVHKRRPSLDLNQVATGEHWHGSQALDLGLIDALGTSDDYLLSRHTKAQLIKVSCQQRQGILKKLGASALGELHSWCYGQSIHHHY